MSGVNHARAALPLESAEGADSRPTRTAAQVADAREQARLAALRRFAILDTPADREFDDLVGLASRLFAAPIALVSLVDAGRQWFKARIGLVQAQTPREHSFCTHALAEDDVLVVEDATCDPRFAANPLVTGEPGIRFYAGAPLRTPDGHAIGTLCVIDRVPRKFESDQRGLLELLARQAFALVERHYAVGCMSSALADNENLQVCVELEHERLGLALDAADLGWWEWVVPVDTITIGGHFERLLGLAPGQFDGSSNAFFDLVHPADRTRVRAAAQAVLDGGPTCNLEFRARSSGSEERWLVASGRLTRSSSGKPLSVNGTIRDVTASRRTEQALRESEALLRGFLDHAAVTMNLRTLDGRYLLVNRAFEDLFGVTEAQAVGKRDLDLLPKMVDARAFQEQIKAVLTTGKPVSVANRIRNVRGEIVDLLTTRFPVLGADGTIRAIGTVGVDAGGLQQARRELVEVNAGLERGVADRTRELAAANEEIEAFSYAAAHDLRAPLRAIVGFCALLMENDGTDLPPQAASHARRIQANAKRMTDLIERLLEFGRTARSHVDKRTFDCAALVRETMAELVQESADRRIDVRIDADADCWADRPLLKQVFVNLIGNAYKFTRNAPSPRIEITCVDRGDELSICVADNGVGFDPAGADRLFRAFQRLHRASEFEGTGLGLAIAHRIVQLHGGRMWAESKPGCGAKFHFSLPARRRDHRPRAVDGTAPAGGPVAGKPAGAE
jgi:PAS domain S-box-containing protein